MFDHGVQNRQQLAHARHQCDFGRLAGCLESLTEGFDDGVVSRRDHGTHIQGAAHDGASTPSNAAAA